MYLCCDQEESWMFDRQPTGAPKRPADRVRYDEIQRCPHGKSYRLTFQFADKDVSGVWKLVAVEAVV